MGLCTGFALLVVAVQDVVPVAEPRFGDRAVARYADPVPVSYTHLVQAGEPQDWLKETHAICVGIYEDSPEGTKISYDYVDKYTPVIEQQFVRGGYRLARLLNEIYR